jgi:hypothetical protein
MKTETAEIRVSREDGKVTVRLAGKVIGIAKGNKLIIPNIDGVIEGEGWARVSGFRPSSDGELALVADAKTYIVGGAA